MRVYLPCRYPHARQLGKTVRAWGADMTDGPSERPAPPFSLWGLLEYPYRDETAGRIARGDGAGAENEASAGAEDDDRSPEGIFDSARRVLVPSATINRQGNPGGTGKYLPRGLVLRLSEEEFGEGYLLHACYIWNAGLLLADCVAKGWWWVRLPADRWMRRMLWNVADMDVLEMGAATGLVGMCASLAGARRVAITDYPVTSILDAIQSNIQRNRHASRAVEAHGHEWGETNSGWAAENAACFDRVLAADTIWEASARAALAQSMAHFLRDTASAQVWIVAGFHKGRYPVSNFLDVELQRVGLGIIEIREVDIDGYDRAWNEQRQETQEESDRWSVVAKAGWKKYATSQPGKP